MLTRKKNLLICFFLLLFCSFSRAYSDESEFAISVDAILPENQLTPGVKYFDLRMEPSKEQKVLITLTNHTNEKVDLKVVYSNAKTTSQGVIEYSENKNLKIESPEEYLFTNIVSGPSEIFLDAEEEKNIELTLKMPEKEYDGFIAGGIEFIKGIEKEDTSTIQAQRSYLVGMRLSETDVKLPISLDLNETIVGMKNYKSAILVSLVNKNARYIEDLTINAVVTKENESTILLETELTQIRIAPYSVLEVPIYLKESLLDVGDYQLKLTAKDEEGFNKEWDQSFRVTKRDLELFKENQELWDGKKETFLLKSLFLYSILLLVIIILIIVFFVKKDKLYKKIKVKGKTK